MGCPRGDVRITTAVPQTDDDLARVALHQQDGADAVNPPVLGAFL
jgi:hypothetical protein